VGHVVLREAIVRHGRPVAGFGVGAVTVPVATVGVGLPPIALALAGHAASAATGLVMERALRGVIGRVWGGA
jgi:hypothetical protein